jgi:hypothetical protein
MGHGFIRIRPLARLAMKVTHEPTIERIRVPGIDIGRQRHSNGCIARAADVQTDLLS